MTLRTEPIRIALAQMNATVGDLAGNAEKIRDHIRRAREEEAALVVFPELALSGYPPEDLLLKTHFLDAVRGELEELASEVRDVVALVGFPERADDVYNAAAVLADGRYADRVAASTSEANRHGINAIPAFVLGQRLLVLGAQPEALFERAVAELGRGDEELRS